MPTYPAQNSKQPGFTLIELLIVLVLIGTLAGAVFNQAGFRPVDNDIEDAAKTIEGSIIKAMDLSLLRQTDIGLFAIENEIIWKEIQVDLENEYEPITWLELDVFWSSTIKLPDDIILSAIIDGAEQTLLAEHIDEPVPLLVIQRDGETYPPMTLKLQSSTEIGHIILDGVHEPELEFHVQE